MRCIIEWSGAGRGSRWWHRDSGILAGTWGRNKHAANVFATKAEAESERETYGLSPHTTAIVAAPPKYVTGSIEGFARRGLRRVT